MKTPYQIGTRVILPNGHIGVIIKELEIGEFEVLSTRADGTLFREYRYPEELKPYKGETNEL